MQLAVDISASCKGRVDMADLVPHEKTLMAEIGRRAKSCRAELVPRIKEAIKDKRCQASTDMYTDEQNQHHLIAITVHFNDKDWENGENQGESYDLVVAKFPTELSASGTNVRNAMFRAMADLGFTAIEFESLE